MATNQPSIEPDERDPRLLILGAIAALVFAAGAIALFLTISDDEQGATDGTSTTVQLDDGAVESTGPSEDTTTEQPDTTEVTTSSTTSSESTATTEAADPRAVLLTGGALLAWVDESGTLQTETTPVEFPGEFRELAPDGTVSEAVVAVGTEAMEACPLEIVPDQRPNVFYETDNDGILVSGSSIVAPRSATITDGSEDVIDDVRRFLGNAGVPERDVDQVTAFRVDLDGNGTEEVIVEAESGSLFEIDDDPNKYSMLFVRRIVDGEVESELIDVVTTAYEVVDGEYFAPSYDVATFVDLDRDGAIEVVIRSWDFESAGTTVVELSTGDTLSGYGCGV